VEVCLCEWRNLVCGAMVFILPASLMAQDSARAMLHADGGVWLNGNPAPNSSAIFLHDVIQTQTTTSAKIDTDGSTATVQPETIVQFEEDELVLDHGGLQVNTSRGLRVRVNCMTVIPVNAGTAAPLSQDWTRYDVVDVDGKVQVEAYQNDVKIHYRSVTTRGAKQGQSLDVLVHQGEKVTREERCGAAARPADVINARGAILNSVWAKGAGLATIGILTCWALCRGDDPVSPSKP
jgi:hypothetical protein